MGTLTSPGGPNSHNLVPASAGPCTQTSAIAVSRVRMTAMIASRQIPALPMPPSLATKVPLSELPAKPG